MTDEFKSLKQLGKTISKDPPEVLLQHWKNPLPANSPLFGKDKTNKRSGFSRVNWWQLAAALVAGIFIGKFLLQSNPQLFSTMAKNTTDDETFEYIYTNN